MPYVDHISIASGHLLNFWLFLVPGRVFMTILYTSVVLLNLHFSIDCAHAGMTDLQTLQFFGQAAIGGTLPNY